MSFIGRYRPPGDKSITHRALILSSMAEGVCDIRGALISEDTLSTIRCLRLLGVRIEEFSKLNFIRVYGVGKYGFHAPKDVLDCGNSGTTMRLLTGLLAAQSFKSILTGDKSLLKRPMERVAEPLRLMGAQISLSENGTAPISIFPSTNLRGITYRMETPSAQVETALQIASLYASSPSVIICDKILRSHTSLLLKEFDKCTYERELKIVGDFSSAAFFIVGAVLSNDSDVVVENVGLNEGRIGLLHALYRMGARIEGLEKNSCYGEPVGSLRVRSSSLTSCRVESKEIPSLVDEVPLLAIAAAFADGRTEINGLGELRVKESNRLAAISDFLCALDVQHGINGDDLWIEGKSDFQHERVKAMIRRIDAHYDHRIAMCKAVLNHVFGGEVLSVDSVCVSYPDFYKDFNQLTMPRESHRREVLQ